MAFLPMTGMIVVTATTDTAATVRLNVGEYSPVLDPGGIGA